MIACSIPGRGDYAFAHAVFDFNGTIATGGMLDEGVKDAFAELSKLVRVHVLTADTYGSVQRQCEGLDVDVVVFPTDHAAQSKEAVVQSLTDGVVCIGNGFNDVRMFDAADLSIAVIGGEGACVQALSHADVVVTSSKNALDLLLSPSGLVATLRG